MSDAQGREGLDEAKVKFSPGRLKKSELVLLGRMNKILGFLAYLECRQQTQEVGRQ